MPPAGPPTLLRTEKHEVDPTNFWVANTADQHYKLRPIEQYYYNYFKRQFCQIF